MMRKLLPIILISILLAACGKQPEQHIEGTAFGTIYHITYLGDRSEKLPRQVDSVLKEINRTFSVFDTNSIISRINQGEDLLPNKDFLKVLEASLVISKQTYGADRKSVV